MGIGGVSITYNKLPLMTDRLEKTLSALVRKTAFDVERGAKANAPVDTGALRASITTLTFGNSSLPTSSPFAKAAKRATTKAAKSSFATDYETPQDSLEAIVTVAVEYGMYIEYGTSKAAAHPFLTPALMAVQSGFQAAVGKAILEAAL